MIKYRIEWMSSRTNLRTAGEPVFDTADEAWRAIKILAPIASANGTHWVTAVFVATPFGQRLAQLFLLASFVALVVLLSV